jgi:hypothetical protein
VAISEAARNDLYNGLRDILGSDRAETLMSVVPLHNLDEVATKRDLAELREATRADIAELRTEVKVDIATLKTDIAKLGRSTAIWGLTITVTILGSVVGTAVLG